MINWAIASDLDRVDHHRASAEWVAELWRAEDAKLLKLDAESRFTTNAGGSKLRMTKPFVAYDSQRHRLLGLLNGSPIFAVETLTEGEVHDFREVGFQLTDNERDIAATAAALTHWHRMEPQCPRCGRRDCGDQRRVRAPLRSMRPRPFPSYRSRSDRRSRRCRRSLAARRPTHVGQSSVGVGRLCGKRRVTRAGHPPRNRRRGRHQPLRLALLRQPAMAVPAFADGRVLRAGGGTNINIDTREIAHAEWYTRDQLSAKLDSGELALPGRSSIALRMIEAWREGQAPI